MVVVFTCNSCPVAADYEDRIIAFAKRHATDVAVVAINVNRIAEDSLPKMKERASEKHFPFVYLYDESQKIAKAYGATFTPEFFILDADRKIAYMGGMDDNSNPGEVKAEYLEPAITAVLAGEKPAKTETVARVAGCAMLASDDGGLKPSSFGLVEQSQSGIERRGDDLSAPGQAAAIRRTGRAVRDAR